MVPSEGPVCLQRRGGEAVGRSFSAKAERVILFHYWRTSLNILTRGQLPPSPPPPALHFENSVVFALQNNNNNKAERPFHQLTCFSFAPSKNKLLSAGVPANTLSENLPTCATHPQPQCLVKKEFLNTTVTFIRVLCKNHHHASLWNSTYFNQGWQQASEEQNG